MPRKNRNEEKVEHTDRSQVSKNKRGGKFHIEFKNAAQKSAWETFQQNDILFLTGPAGCGKSFLAMAFAINEILQGNRSKIILTRPIVEAGESLGFLPGDFLEKVNPYMTPLYDSIYKLVGEKNPQRDVVDASVEVAPIAFMRGRTFDDAICIFDEAQNATQTQLKLFLTRFGENSKLIITGDPTQSDLGTSVAMNDIIARLESLPDVGFIRFKTESVVRHPLVGKIIDRLGE